MKARGALALRRLEARLEGGREVLNPYMLDMETLVIVKALRCVAEELMLLREVLGGDALDLKKEDKK